MSQYTLQPYTTPSSRYHCPACNSRQRTFVRYIHTETGEHLADNVGRCGREDKCGYHYKPRDYFNDNPHKSKRTWQPGNGAYPCSRPQGYAKRHTGPDYATMAAKAELEMANGYSVNPEFVNASFNNYEQNYFVQYLISRFGRQLASNVIGRFRIGSAKYWPGATVFWQIDAIGRVRTGKIMLYNAETGRRVKQPFNHVMWVHCLRSLKSEVLSRQSEEHAESGLETQDSRLKTQDFSPRQCFFGEHQLNDEPQKPVAIVESEKTAIIASLYNPEVIWLATGGKSNLNQQMSLPLKNRHVTLYPDLGSHNEWSLKAKQLQLWVPGSVFTVSDILENIATPEQREAGWDLGDYL